MTYQKSPEFRLQQIAVSVRPEMLAVIDKLAEREDTSRARAGRLLIQRGIEAIQREATV